MDHDDDRLEDPRDELEDLEVSEQQAEDVRGGRGRKQPGVRGVITPGGAINPG
jgi:hypothetical protein